MASLHSRTEISQSANCMRTEKKYLHILVSIFQKTMLCQHLRPLFLENNSCTTLPHAIDSATVKAYLLNSYGSACESMRVKKFRLVTNCCNLRSSFRNESLLKLTRVLKNIFGACA